MLWGWGILGGVADLERDGGLVHEGDFWVNGTGVRGDRDLCGGCFVVAGGTWGFGGREQGSDWELGG